MFSIVHFVFIFFKSLMTYTVCMGQVRIKITITSNQKSILKIFSHPFFNKFCLIIKLWIIRQKFNMIKYEKRVQMCFPFASNLRPYFLQYNLSSSLNLNDFILFCSFSYGLQFIEPWLNSCYIHKTIEYCIPKYG